MLSKHFGSIIYDAAHEEKWVQIHCLDVSILGVNKNLHLITVLVKGVMDHMMYHMVYIVYDE